MFLRNKGTTEKPKWQLVESCWMPATKKRKQTVLCHLGICSSFEDVIRLWEMIAKDARKAKRNDISIVVRDKDNPILKEYARGLHLYQINERLKQYRKWKARFEHHDKVMEATKTKRELSIRGHDPSKSIKTKLAILELTTLILKIRRDDYMAKWNSEIRTSIKALLKEIVSFHGDL